ncbi:MAG: hypothetical protein JOZ93_00040 [Sinobacteraceae bacterium]|nr:hypothetical protein [Nevskiaceae bacterium]
MTTLDTAVKSFACGFAALAISTVLSWTFVESTSSAPFAIKPAVTDRMTSAPRAHYLATRVHGAPAASSRA